MYSKDFALQNNYNVVVHYYKIINKDKIYIHEMMHIDHYDNKFKFIENINVITLQFI
jgi:hypothetical protein